jgi:hypothetical protein
LAAERAERTTWVLATGGGVALLFGLGKLFGDLKNSVAERGRPREPWEI